MAAGGYNVGDVNVKLGAKLDDDGFNRWEKRYEQAERKARDPITAKADVKADTSGLDRYNRRLDEANNHNDNFVRGSARMRGGLGALMVGGAGFAAVGVGAYAMARGVAGATAAFEESEKTGRRQALVIKTMGQDAGATAEHVNKLASAMAKKTGVDDDQIIAGANMIRTFRNIRNEAGKGNDVFDRTTKAALDLSSAFGTDLQSASILLGKALDNPSKGAAALGRTGAIAKDDVEKLKKMAESGTPILEQQKFVLEAVENQVKGTAESNATATDKMKQSWGEFAEWIGGKVAPAWNSALASAGNFLDSLQNGRGTVGRFGEDLDRTSRAASGAFGDAMDYAGDALDDNAKSIKSLQGTARLLWSNITRYFSGIKKAFTDTFGGRSGAGRDIRNIIQALGTIVAAAARIAVQLQARLIRPVTQIFRGFLQIIRGVIRVVAGVLTGDFDKAWEGVKDIFKGAFKALGGMLKYFVATLRNAAELAGKALLIPLRAVWNIVKSVFSAGVRAAGNAIKGAAGWIGEAASDLGRAIVDGVKAAPGALADAGSWVAGKIRSGVASLWKEFYSVGGFLLGKIKKGLEDAIGGLLGIGGKIVDKIKSGIGGAISIPFRLTGSGDPPPGSMARGWKTAGTRAFAAAFEKKYGLRFSSGYRSPAQNKAAGGVPNSNHMKGSPSNPGAIDLVGSTENMYAAAAEARRLGVPEVLVHDVGSGLHLHMGFFAQGGLMPRKVDRPNLVMTGEEAPQHNEWILSENPAYRGRTVPLLADAARSLGYRIEAYARSGRRGKRKPLKPTLNKKNRGIVRSAARGDRGLPKYEKKIQTLEREYDQLDRRIGGGDESDFLVEHDDGSVTVDEEKRNALLGNLNKLIEKRTAIRDAINEYAKKAQEVVTKMREGIKKLRAALKRAGKSGRRSKERAGYKATIAEYQDRIKDLIEIAGDPDKKDSKGDLWFDAEDSNIDLEELLAERKEFEDKKGKPADSTDPDGGTGGTATPEQIAAAASEQLASFNASRADLFSSFGSNFTAAGASPFRDETQRAAGMRYYGATGASDTRGGERIINVTNNFETGPADPHTWTQQQRFEIEAAL
jgi:hypothetical protein